jgi:PBP1b-binding outer membrane lipoprotein LpoB
MRRTAPLMPIALLALAVFVAGCGSDTADKQEYIKKNNEIQKDVTEGISAISGSDPAAIEAAQGEVDKAVDDLKALDVPGDYEDEHKQLVGSIEDMSDIMGDMSVAMEEKDTEAISGIQTRISKAQDEFQAAVKSMNEDRS